MIELPQWLAPCWPSDTVPCRACTAIAPRPEPHAFRRNLETRRLRSEAPKSAEVCVAWSVLIAGLPRVVKGSRSHHVVAQTVVFGLAIGFVISAVVSNVFQLVTNGQSMFHFPVNVGPAAPDDRWASCSWLGRTSCFGAANRSLRIGDWPATYVVGLLRPVRWSGRLCWASPS